MRCRLCQRPLEAPDRLRGLTVCRHAACRGRTEAGRIEAQRQAFTQAAMDQVRALQPPRPVREPVWLLPFDTTLADTTKAQRQDFAQALADIARQPAPQPDPPAMEADEADAGSGPIAAMGGQLCGHCGGRCCTAGRDDHAFLHEGALADWLAEHPGARPEDAVAFYVAALPAAHVQGSCLYHTQQGCALPRERRSETCNRFRCSPFRTMAEAARQQPPQGVAVLRARGGQMESVALITPGRGLERLPP
ncbi:MAG: hypothetical protein ACK4PH_13680 [Aquincola tertiaricarbonis]